MLSAQPATHAIAWRGVDICSGELTYTTLAHYDVCITCKMVLQSGMHIDPSLDINVTFNALDPSTYYMHI